MPSNRKVIFANGEYYHVFNRGVEKRIVFTNKYEFSRALETANFYRFSELGVRYSKYLNFNKKRKIEFMQAYDVSKFQIEIVTFCLMDNHFHFLLKQKKDNGIVKFMAKFTNSYTKYFNTKHQRVGPLFQGVFKAVHVISDEQLIHLSRYIHLNPVNGYKVKIEDLENYQWSSYQHYIGVSSSVMVDDEVITNLFKNPKDYKDFTNDQADYLGKFNKIEFIVID